MSLEDELFEISAKINTEESQLRLQQILTDKSYESEMFSPKAQELLHNISSSLTKSLLESKLYHLINSSKFQPNMDDNFSFGRAVLDLNGDFVWHDKATERLFQYPSHFLLNSNLFSLMSPCSVSYLFSKYSQELLCKSSKIVISYILSNGVELSSRCSLVNYNIAAGCYKRGVLLETRLCRHKVFSYNSLNISPLIEYCNNNLLFTPILISLTPFVNNEVCVVDLENLRITPFLKNDSPYKRRKIDEHSESGV